MVGGKARCKKWLKQKKKNKSRHDDGFESCENKNRQTLLFTLYSKLRKRSLILYGRDLKGQVSKSDFLSLSRLAACKQQRSRVCFSLRAHDPMKMGGSESLRAIEVLSIWRGASSLMSDRAIGSIKEYLFPLLKSTQNSCSTLAAYQNHVETA